jgi:sulfatase maturation enzyme AslB (radical SAM superfamily)
VNSGAKGALGRVARGTAWGQILLPEEDCFVLVRPDGRWHLFDELYKPRLHEAYEQHSLFLRAPERPLVRRPQISLIVFVSEACNLRCSYCKVSSMITAPQKTPTDRHRIVAAIQEAAKATPGQVDVIFYGGEPLLEFEAIDTICHEVSASPAGERVFYSMTTNGTLLNERMLAILLHHRICVGVSIDGNPLTHNAHRLNAGGRETHGRAVANYRAMKHAGIECGPISVVTQPSRLENVFDYFHKEFGDTTVHLKPLEVAGTEELAWLVEYFTSYVEVQLRLLARCVDEVKRGLPRRVETRTLGAVRKVLASGDPNVEGCRTSGARGCSIGQEILGIEADGTRIPCPNGKKFTRKDPEWIHMLETRGGYCTDCRYEPLCPSFCMAELSEAYLENYSAGGDRTPLDVLCAANRRLVDGILGLYRKDAAALVRYAS